MDPGANEGRYDASVGVTTIARFQGQLKNASPLEGKTACSRVVSSGSETAVIVMEAADLRNGRYFAGGRRLDGTGLRRVLRERQVSPARMMVLSQVLSQSSVGDQAITRLRARV